MFRKFSVLLLLLVPVGVSAQAYPGNTNTPCSLFDLTGVTVAKCSGFWSGNLFNVDAGNPSNAAQNTALAALGIAAPVTVLEKFALPDPSVFVDFSTLLYGWTVVGFHWGNGVFNANYPGYNGRGGGSAFYLFDAGTTGLDKLYFSAMMQQSISNATLFLTDDPGTPQEIVPEPATMSLLAMGLAGMTAASRRRRKK